MFTCFPEDLFKDKSAHLDRWRLVKRAFFENCTESHAVLQSERIANDVQQTSKNRSLWQIRNNFRMTKLPKEDLQFPWTRAMRKSKRVSLHQGKFSFRESSSGDAGNKSRCKEQQFSGKCCIRQSSEVKTKGIWGNNINMQGLLHISTKMWPLSVPFLFLSQLARAQNFWHIMLDQISQLQGKSWI